MGTLKTREEYKKVFIERSIKKHDGFYTYEKVVYVNTDIKVEITCPVHGPFLQNMYKHYSTGRGCPKCARERTNKGITKWNQESYIKKVIEIHPTLDFSSTVLVKTNLKLKYVCPIHGEKEALGQSLLKGHGCRNCSLGGKKRITAKERIRRMNKVHNFKYNYSKTYLEGNLEGEKVTIICPVHNAYQQRLRDHINGNGCPKCHEPTLWTHGDWVKKGSNSKNFDSFKVYIIRCWNETEEFYKIGKTYLTLKERFGLNSKDMPYNYKVIKIFEAKEDGRRISELERQLHSENSEHVYIPLEDFGGKTECFSKIIPPTGTIRPKYPTLYPKRYIKVGKNK